MTRWCAVLIAGLAGATAPPAAAQPPAETRRAEELFATRLLPVLKEKCFGCHGDEPEKLRGGLDLRSRESMLAGGDSGEPALVPGDAVKSPIARAVAWDGPKMPPKENDRLTREQIGWVRQWVAGGAPWPDEQSQRRIREAAARAAGGVAVRTSGGLTDEWTNRR